MDRIHVSTVVYLPPEEIYDFLLDFPRYARYSEYLTHVRRYGDGTPGTEYDLRFSWWKVGYTLRSRVTGTDPPERIDWTIVEDIDASGAWVVEPIDVAEGDSPAGTDSDSDSDSDCDGDVPASRVHLKAGFDADSAEEGSMDIPRLVSTDWVVRRVKPLALTEAKRVVSRAVRDLEGDSRQVDLTVHSRPDVI